MKPFRNSGFKFLAKFETLEPLPVSVGTYAFTPSLAASQPGTPTSATSELFRTIPPGTADGGTQSRPPSLSSLPSPIKRKRSGIDSTMSASPSPSPSIISRSRSRAPTTLDSWTDAIQSSLNDIKAYFEQGKVQTMQTMHQRAVVGVQSESHLSESDQLRLIHKFEQRQILSESYVSMMGSNSDGIRQAWIKSILGEFSLND
jgi:hypothetical protein